MRNQIFMVLCTEFYLSNCSVRSYILGKIFFSQDAFLEVPRSVGGSGGRLQESCQVSQLPSTKKEEKAPFGLEIRVGQSG